MKSITKGLTPFGIFRQAGFDISMIGRETPGDCLYRWRNQRTIRQKRERPKSKDKITDKEKLKYLETENAYLKAENDFLIKLRKKSLN